MTSTTYNRRSRGSGYVGVSWHKAAAKWMAYIYVERKRKYLGLFESAEAAHPAYSEAARSLAPPAQPLPPAEKRANLLATVQSLYAKHGFKALSTPFLEKQRGALYPHLLEAGLKQPVLLAELGLVQAYEDWKRSSRTYRDSTKSQWTWDVAIQVAAEIKEREGDLPTVQWCRMNGYSSLVGAVHTSEHTWEDLREAVGSFATCPFYESRNGMRWRSRPEASLSNFLYARGIEHKRGERYPDEYAIQSGRQRGYFALHFRATKASDWIDVEIWGDLPDNLTKGRYAETRDMKEAFNADRPAFLGIQYQDCLSDARLATIFQPKIGQIQPFNFDKPTDTLIKTSHWSDADELLKTCRNLAAQMPDGILPSEQWLRKRGKYANRDGPLYSTLATRINEWIGGIRNARKMLGQAQASTVKWTPERVLDDWKAFQIKYGMTPSQYKGARNRLHLPADIVAEATRIYGAATQYGLLEKARDGHNTRIKWTRDAITAAWRNFVSTYGLTPSQCMSSAQRQAMPKPICDEATNIYGAARRLGMLQILRTPTTG